MYRKIAKILGVSEADIATMPTEILNSMQALFETIDVQTDSDRKIIYSELDKLWTKGVVFLGLKEVAESTKIADSTLFSLDFEIQQKLVFEYMADSENITHFYEIVNSALEISELKNVAELTEIPVENLKKLPLEIQKKMCGYYSMEYKKNGDNSALIVTLKGLVS
ncbi:MAG: hypothetical protein NC548_48025 [Lachnospiraceae bacterium]|nr:hypothetical protein [Lachnospiraceae bacterium]MCM1231501.1 hypothetical protein [Ruminococcus flavefaciens]